MINKIDNSNNTAFRATLKVLPGMQFSKAQADNLAKKFAEKTKFMPDAVVEVGCDGFACGESKLADRLYTLDDEGESILAKMSVSKLLPKLVKVLRAFKQEVEVDAATNRYLTKIQRFVKKSPEAFDSFADGVVESKIDLRQDLNSVMFNGDDLLSHIVTK